MNCSCGRRAETLVTYRSLKIKYMCGVHATQAMRRGTVIGIEAIR